MNPRLLLLGDSLKLLATLNLRLLSPRWIVAPALMIALLTANCRLSQLDGIHVCEHDLIQKELDLPIQPELLPDYSNRKIQALKGTVDYIHVLFQTCYGPIRWKQRQWGWNPDGVAEKAKTKIDAMEDAELDSFKPIFNCLMDSTRDAHVSIKYADYRRAKLPFKTCWIDNRVIVKKSELSSLKPGDEIVSIDGEPILDYISQSLYGANADEAPLARPSLDLARAFTRYGRIDAMPKNLEGAVRIIAKRGDKTIKAVAVWDFEPDTRSRSLLDSQNLLPSERAESTSLELASNRASKAMNDLKKPHRPVALTQQLLARRESPYAQLKRESRPSKKSSSSSSEDFHTAHWNMREVRGTKIAYFRLPNFTDDEVIETLDKAIPEMMKSSQALLIDLRGNGGGYAAMCSAIISRLTQKPLLNILESTLLDIATISKARELADFYEQALEVTTTDQQLHEIILDEDDYYIGERDNILGLYISRDLVKEWMLLAKANIEEWDNGFTCSRFIPSMGHSTIQPHPHLRYNKPIYLLIDEKAGSCGDIFPAILRDNGRATLLGRTTAGLGGAIESYEIPNFCGITSFTLTHSLLLRNNQSVIEDLGIAPHYEYILTLEDALKPRRELIRSLDFIADELEKQLPTKASN